ncbi:hypothetical protein F5B21DRAFT_100607 [Xylaria acuta]|nr:hypothetical protein F5B21DRAFT_100607 [Xylaria acuta]
MKSRELILALASVSAVIHDTWGSKSGRSHWMVQSTPTSNLPSRRTQPGDKRMNGIWSLRVALPTLGRPVMYTDDSFSCSERTA